MALQTPVVTVANVTEPQDKLYRISFRMVANDPAGAGLDVPHTIDFNQGNDVGEKVAEVIAFFQDKIDRYQREEAVKGTAALTNTLASINSGLAV
jgi:hypothetical protein